MVVELSFHSSDHATNVRRDAAADIYPKAFPYTRVEQTVVRPGVNNRFNPLAPGMLIKYDHVENWSPLDGL